MCNSLYRSQGYPHFSPIVSAVPRITKCLAAVLLLLLGVLNPRSARPANAASVVLDPTNFVSLGTFSLATGQSVTFNTDAGTWSGDVTGTGGIVNANSTSLTAFTFDAINIASGATVTYIGSRALALLSKGDVTVAGVVNASALGGAGVVGYTGQGPGGGGPGMDGSAGGGGAGFATTGGAGGRMGFEAAGVPGSAYSQSDLSQETQFPVGSAGGGTLYAGGAGGGGIAIFALGTANLSGQIVADGVPSAQTEVWAPGPGGGSGGAILLVAPSLTGTYTLFVRGGRGLSGRTTNSLIQPVSGGGGGAGGRVAIVTDSVLSGVSLVTGGPGGSGQGGNPGSTGGNGTEFARAFSTLTAGTPRQVGASIPLTATLTLGSGSSFLWDFGDGITTTTGVRTTNHVYASVGTYDLRVTATMAGSGATATTTATISVAKGDQTIAFAPLVDRPLITPPFTVSAIASSGLPVSFTAGGTCTVLDGMVTLTERGLCTITAHQAGDADYNAAPDVSRSFTVQGPVYLPLITR